MKATTNPIGLARGQQRAAASLRVAPPTLLRCDGRVVAAPAVRAAGRRRALRAAPATRASLSPQGPFMSGPGASGPGPGPVRRVVRRPRDLKQLMDVLSGGAADDPEQFLQLLSAAPRVMERRRAPPPPPSPPLQPTTNRDAEAEQYARQLQQQQLQQLQELQQQRQAAAAAAAAAEVRRRAQQEQEEEQRREALRAAMLQNARRHLPQYDAPSLARLASALAAAGVRDPALCDDMLRQLTSQPVRPPPPQQQKQQKLPLQLQQQHQRQPPQEQRQVLSEPRSLAELLDAFAAMRHRPSDAQLSELLRLQQQEQQKQQELERLRQVQAAQLLKSQPRLQPRGMGAPPPEAAKPAPPAPPPSAGGAAAGRTTPPEDAARLLYALSRLGYRPDEGTLTQLLDQLQPQRLQLQPAAAAAVVPAVEVEQQQQQQEEGGEEEEEGEEAAERRRELEDQLSYSLQRDAQAVASAVRALERMGRPDKAAQLRERFTRHVREVQERAAMEREAAAAAERERQRQRQQQEAAAAAAAERARERQAAAAKAAAERQEGQTRALRLQLARKLRTADQWQQIRALLFTYPEALDVDCLAAAAARLAELLALARRSGRGLAMTLRERGELGDLMEGLGQLVMRRLEGASAAQAASLLVSVVRMRHLEEGLLVGLLRRLRDTRGEAGPGEAAAVLRALAECSVRPSKLWMEAFLGRCEDLLEGFTPEDLADLPVSLAQLGAHPGRSWLGSYLDVLQEREGELSQSSVSEAVRAVALLDRSFLSAWRQAAAVRQQQRQQAQLQAQAQARAAAAAAAAAAQQEQQEQQQGQESLAPPERQPADALASVDELLARPDVRQDEQDEAVQEGLLPPMHPKQRDIAGAGTSAGLQHPQAQQQQQPEPPQQPPQLAPRAQALAPAQAASRAAAAAAPMQSIELDVDASDLPCSVGGDVTPSASGASPTAAPAAAAAAAVPASGRQLPGSFSIDGFYSPEPYDVYDDEYEDQWDEDEGEYIGEEPEEEAWPAVSSSTATEAPPGRDASAAASTAGTAAADTKPEAAAAAAPAAASQPHLGADGSAERQQAADDGQERPGASAQAKPQQHQVSEQEEQGKQQQEQPQQPKPEDLAQARALRSLLLERYEAVAAYKDEVEERRRRAAAAVAEQEQQGADGAGGPRVISGREVAAAGRLLAAREQLQRLQADFDNFKRRASEEREQSLARAKADILRPLLAVVDNFERAATQIKPKTDGERAIQDAYQAVYAELMELLKKEGLQEVGAEGEAFDPNQHEAVMREDRDDVEDGTVTGVFQKGYRLGEVLVRPALVKVAYS